MKCTNFSLLSLPTVLITVVYIAFILLILIDGALTISSWRTILSVSKPIKSNQSLSVSIIICAHNEIENLEKHLPFILNQDYPNFEVILGLDRCTDGSIEYVQSVANDRLVPVIIHETPSGWNSKKFVLRQCIDKAQNDWLLLTDADCQPQSSKWIQSYVDHMSGATNLVLGVSPYQKESHIISLITEYETYITANKFLTQAIKGETYMGVGRNIAYTKSLFREVSGFEDIAHITGGDDDLLVQKMAPFAKVSVNIQKESLTYSAPERTWRKYLTQKTRHLSVGKYYQEKFKKKLSTSAVLHSSLWLSFLYLIGFSDTIWRIIVPFATLVLIKGLFFKKIANQLNMPLRVIWYPVMDLIYAVFLPLVAIRAVLARNIRWKK